MQTDLAVLKIQFFFLQCRISFSIIQLWKNASFRLKLYTVVIFGGEISVLPFLGGMWMVFTVSLVPQNGWDFKSILFYFYFNSVEAIGKELQDTPI